MSWRTVVVSTRCKLDLKMGYLVIRGEDTKRIFLDEIAVLIIENPAIAITGCLLMALSDKKIKTIFCDSKRNPYAELVPYHGSFDCSRKVKNQINWSQETKNSVWKNIIADKIGKQAQHLGDLKKYKEAKMLESYISEIEPDDITNREGHAAKVYFNALFGMDFKRSDDNDPINASLNYGYSIILSAFNRAVVANGYLTEIGIHHDNVFNFFNLSSDIMEPYRIIIDRKVYELEPNELTKDIKYSIVSCLNDTVRIADSNQTVLNSIDIYTRSILNALNENDISHMKFYSP